VRAASQQVTSTADKTLLNNIQTKQPIAHILLFTNTILNIAEQYNCLL
jgi:hypothetical protein